MSTTSSSNSSSLSDNALRLLECAISIDNHIVMESIPLSCGHCICRQCIPESHSFNCKLCNKLNEIDLRTCKESFTTKCLFDTYISDLFELLEDRIKTSVKKLKNSRNEYEKIVKLKIKELRKDIDNRVDNLKAQLDSLKNNLNIKLDKINEEILQMQDESNNDQNSNDVKNEFEVKLKKILKEIRKSKTQTDQMFIDYQKELINCNKLINKITECNFSIEFKASSYNISANDTHANDHQTFKEIIGDIKFTNNNCISSILKSNYELGNLNELLGWPRNRQYKLIYKAKKDGFSSDIFHSKCDNISNTLTIIKTMNGYIFGGFTTQVWNQSCSTDTENSINSVSNGFDSQLNYYQDKLSDTNIGYKYDRLAFIFSYRNKLNKPFKIDVSDPKYAIQCNNTCCMCFGQSDLWIYNNSNTNTSSFSNLNRSYSINSIKFLDSIDPKTLLADSHTFQVDDIEVFKIIF